mmetsp:Transcript_52956/g.152561  ORF Transcript_52956/g.152561 Transcript_52956/m.152561 type:complete len:223 (+) Transcript_52956:370-1038(+)
MEKFAHTRAHAQLKARARAYSEVSERCARFVLLYILRRSFCRRFFSPWSQRWQYAQSLPAMQPFLESKKAHGLQSRVSCPAEPTLGKPDASKAKSWPRLLGLAVCIRGSCACSAAGAVVEPLALRSTSCCSPSSESGRCSRESAVLQAEFGVGGHEPPSAVAAESSEAVCHFEHLGLGHADSASPVDAASKRDDHVNARRRPRPASSSSRSASPSNSPAVTE